MGVKRERVHAIDRTLETHKNRALKLLTHLLPEMYSPWSNY